MPTFVEMNCVVELLAGRSRVKVSIAIVETASKKCHKKQYSVIKKKKKRVRLVELNYGKRLLSFQYSSVLWCSITLSSNPSHRLFSWTVVGSSVQQPVGVHGGHVGSCHSELAQFSTQRVAFMVQRVASIVQRQSVQLLLQQLMAGNGGLCPFTKREFQRLFPIAQYTGTAQLLSHNSLSIQKRSWRLCSVAGVSLGSGTISNMVATELFFLKNDGI